ncbi:hypothetical protein ACQP1P_21975 [Dactylosporangium sp. CA-052675]|uniref:hypothetical protein n=1 Tax=Dactylosporangium sp. CA-052675 TaxID=3239927 RepID=UPI003D8CFCFE
MFVIDCPAHRSRVLLSERRVRSLRNTDAGVLLDLECYCGHVERIRTGRAAAALARDDDPERTSSGSPGPACGRPSR